MTHFAFAQLITNKPFLIPWIEPIQLTHTAQEGDESGNEGCLMRTLWVNSSLKTLNQGWRTHHSGSAAYVRGENVLMENCIINIPPLASGLTLPYLSTAEGQYRILWVSHCLCMSIADATEDFSFRSAGTEWAGRGGKPTHTDHALLRSRGVVCIISFILHNHLLRYMWLNPFWRLGNRSWVVVI